MVKMSCTLHTDGSGYWSRRASPVEVTGMELRVYDDYTGPYGELRVYFNTNKWRTSRHGLIYTDRLWLEEFKAELVRCGFAEKVAERVDYSEQGMQGRNYVSLDVRGSFLKEWKKRVKEVLA